MLEFVYLEIGEQVTTTNHRSQAEEILQRGRSTEVAEAQVHATLAMVDQLAGIAEKLDLLIQVQQGA
jgi:hypothetical protein